MKKFVREGIEIGPDRSVLMTDRHENLVDTSFDNNPIYSDDIIDSVRVWSIFRRKKGRYDEGDGNPMLYALKNEKGYSMINPGTVRRRINAIASKFFETNGGVDVTIMVPSSNNLNRYFAEVIGRKCKNPKYIGDVMVKLSIEEVDDFIFEKDSPFRKYYGKRFDAAHEAFIRYCERMRGGFQFHKIHDMTMRSLVEHSIKINDKTCAKYIDAINDKNVIIVDDSVTLGQSLRESYAIVKKYYSPKSISVITLFSPLYNE